MYFCPVSTHRHTQVAAVSLCCRLADSGPAAFLLKTIKQEDTTVARSPWDIYCLPNEPRIEKPKPSLNL